MKPSTIIEFIRDLYQTNEFIPLHSPIFSGNERKYVLETIESTFVSSVGTFVDDFESKIEFYTRASKAVATVNGTAALHTALYMSGIKPSDLVITPALTFIATCNVIYHMGAEPIFIDISPISLGLCPKAVEAYLTEYAELTEDGCIHKNTKQRIRAIVPMHTFGHPVELDELVILCQKWHLTLIEDAAESLGSFYKNKHTGTLGDAGILSFNGNKIITTGGGGMLLYKIFDHGAHAKHITTTAKVPHAYEFYHDELGFNYRMPNINAALGCAQMEVLDQYLEQKRALAQQYQNFFAGTGFQFVSEPEYGKSNYWLNAIICPDINTRNTILQITNESGINVRPVWRLMHRLPMFFQAKRDDLIYSEFIAKHLINLPSSLLRF